MNPRQVLVASFALFTFFSGLAFAQSGTFTSQVSVFNNLNSSAGSHGIGIAASDTPSIFFTRSVNAWSDTWWQWTMGTDNKLRLGFSTVPQLTFQNGALGVGTDNPENRLHVGDGDVRISRASGSWGPNLLLDGTKVGSGGALWGITSATSSDMAGAGRLAFWANGVQRVAMTADGSVGIGTATPAYRLHLVDSTNRVSIGIGEPMTSLTALTGFRIASWDNGNVYVDAKVNSGGTIIYRYGEGEQSGSTNTWMTVKNGNVGIGTTNPTHKLAVNGTIKAKEIIVETTGWSDYVFAADYTLAPLADVEAHIKEHKHLPGIPSAAQVAEQGVSIGDMQARLLAKIEELTLHQIAQEKRLQALEAENAALKKQRP